MSDNKKWLSVDEVCQIYGFKKGTLANWRMNRVNIPFSKAGKIIRYKAEDIDDFLENHMQKVTPARYIYL